MPATPPADWLDAAHAAGVYITCDDCNGNGYVMHEDWPSTYPGGYQWVRVTCETCGGCGLVAHPHPETITTI